MIKIIDVFGQFDSKGTGHYYTFPNGVLSVNGQRAFLDSRADLNGFNMQEAFALFCTTEGWWISIIKKNFRDPRQGYAMLSLCLGDNRPVNGSEAAQTLRQAFDHFVTKRTWDDAQSQSWLQLIQTTPCAKTPFAGSDNMGTNSAYRTYTSEAELAQQLTHISQHGYEKFSRIFLISAAATTVPTATASRMHCVTQEIPVRPFFHFQVPAGVKVSKTGAFSGEMVQITYTKGALESKPLAYKVGEMSNEAYIDKLSGSIVFNAAQPNVVFYKPIQIVAKSDTNRATVALNAKRDFKGNSAYIFYNETARKYYVAETAKGEIATFTVNGHHAYKLKAEELSRVQANGTYAIVLKARQANAWVNVEGRRFRIADNLNVQAANDYLKRHVAEKCGSYDIEFKVGRTQSSGSKQDILGMFFKIMGLIFTILLVVYMFYAVACVCFGFNIWPFQHQQEAPTTEQTENGENVDASAAADPYADTISEEDIKYLKEQDTWDKNALQSNPAKALLDYISSGEVTGIINQHDATLGTIDSNRINGHWKKIIDLLKPIQNDAAKCSKAKAEISRLCRSGKFNLSELQGALQKVCKASDQTTEKPKSTEPASTAQKDKEVPKKKSENKERKAGSSASESNGRGSSNANSQKEKQTVDPRGQF